MSREILLFAALLVILCSTGAARQAWGDGEGGKTYDFAEKLLEEGDYYRAIGEYKRYLFLSPQGRFSEKANFRIAESYYRAQQWKDAIEAFKKFTASYPESTFLPEAFYLQGLAEKQLKRFDDALSTFTRLSQSPSEPERDRALYQSALVLVEKEEWEKARAFFARVPEGSRWYDSARQYLSGLKEIDHLPQKSPVVAGTLAAVLPGAGHLYTERPRDALVTFLLNGSFIWASLELFQHDNDVAGGIVAFLELGWYAGNIYSAVGSAHKYNERIKNDFLEDLKARSSLSLNRDRNGSGFLMYCLSY